MLFGKKIYLNTFYKTFISQSLKTDGGVTGDQAAPEILISMSVSRIHSANKCCLFTVIKNNDLDLDHKTASVKIIKKPLSKHILNYLQGT